MCEVLRKLKKGTPSPLPEQVVQLSMRYILSPQLGIVAQGTPPPPSWWPLGHGAPFKNKVNLCDCRGLWVVSVSFGDAKRQGEPSRQP